MVPALCIGESVEVDLTDQRTSSVDNPLSIGAMHEIPYLSIQWSPYKAGVYDSIVIHLPASP